MLPLLLSAILLTGDSTSASSRFHAAGVAQPIDSILVVKRYRHMYAYNNGKLLKVYNIRLGQQPVGPKHFQGDLKTPEGLYYITQKNPASTCYKSLRISYPGDADRAYARKYGKPTGGDVMIHGILNGEEKNTAEWMKSDWTWGCIAVNNTDMDELYKYVQVGAAINILP
jgi:murein L,D-transpeptidase YafK